MEIGELCTGEAFWYTNLLFWHYYHSKMLRPYVLHHTMLSCHLVIRLVLGSDRFAL